MSGKNELKAQLEQQGEELMSVAKLVNGYSIRLKEIADKLNSEKTMSDFCGNLTQLSKELRDDSVRISSTGNLLINNIES